VVANPEITPTLEDKAKPGGKEEPATATHVQVYGATPPEAVSEYPLPPPYGVPRIASGGFGDVIETGASWMTVMK
jgi:hypothetical protein